jgi:hypothetical protein
VELIFRKAKWVCMFFLNVCSMRAQATAAALADGGKMTTGLTEEAMFWMRLAAFAGVSEYVLTTGASLQDAEELLFGYCLPGDLPSRYASLGGGAANPRILV